MTLSLPGLLDGISPWWWLAAGLLLAGIEAVTITTYLLWPAMAATATALILWLVPELGAVGQIAVFALATIALLVIGRPFTLRRADGRNTLNRRTEGLIGREAIVEGFHCHEGQVRVDGVVWPARINSRKAPEPGERVRIVAADSIVVWVERLPKDAADRSPDPNAAPAGDPTDASR